MQNEWSKRTSLIHDGKQVEANTPEGHRLLDWRLEEDWHRPVKYIIDELTRYMQDPYNNRPSEKITLYQATHAILELNVKINRKLRKLLSEPLTRAPILPTDIPEQHRLNEGTTKDSIGQVGPSRVAESHQGIDSNGNGKATGSSTCSRCTLNFPIGVKSCASCPYNEIDQLLNVLRDIDNILTNSTNTTTINAVIAMCRKHNEKMTN